MKKFFALILAAMLCLTMCACGNSASDKQTLIVGFVAGMIGILATLGLNIVINIILFHFTGLANLKASLPVGGAIALVVISMFLTFIAGLFPSGFAAKRNPVEALRSE